MIRKLEFQNIIPVPDHFKEVLKKGIIKYSYNRVNSKV